jgi:hypothetical protein
MAEQYPDLKDRPVKETICLFDVDGTLTPARLRVSPEMLKLLSELRHKCAIGFVGHPLAHSFLRVQGPEPGSNSNGQPVLSTHLVQFDLLFIWPWPRKASWLSPL